jgi:peptidyl-prolyl isomerase D
LCRQNPLEIVNNLNNLKDQGNKAARGGQFMQAVDIYSQCLSRLDKLADIPALRIALNTNLALMYIRLKAWDDAEKHATLALKIPGIVDEQIAKASYRRGLALIEVKNWKSAQTALEVAKRYAPSDMAIQKALAELEEKRGTQ